MEDLRVSMEKTLELKTFEERKEQLTHYEKELRTFSSKKKVIISQEDLYEFSMHKLEDTLYDTIYGEFPEYSILCCETKESGTETYIHYEKGWVCVGYLWNVIKNSMSLNNVLGGSLRETNSNAKYLLNNNSLKNIYIMIQ